ncbi:hypothetical protein G7054_g135 [Neopestalotiopsis clavispora]|nr:hypothetical protein G7054_g135 [Neopestalotiopsis clavispora]
MPPKTIAIIGGLDVDLVMIANRIPDRGESVLADEYVEVMGGKGANSAIATYRTCHVDPAEASDLDATGEIVKTNVHVTMIGAVGDDSYGEKMVAELKKNGIDTAGIVTVPKTRSSVCFVMIEDQTRENRCLFTHGATATWTKEHFVKPEALGSGIRPDLVVAQMEIAKDVVETMIETAGTARIDFCLNAAPAWPIRVHLYQYVTHLLVNESEAAIMYGCHREDTFTGAYASEYLRQKEEGRWDIRSAVMRANRAAAITIQRFGAQNGIPWADKIDDFEAPFKAVSSALSPPTNTTIVTDDDSH